MRYDIMIGLGLTVASVLTLIAQHSGSIEAASPQDTYALAITTGSGLRLASPGGRAPGGPVKDRAAPRTLSCSGVMRLGIVDVGYSCSAPEQSAVTGSL